MQASKQANAEERLQKAKNAAAAAQEKSREAARQAAESREKVHCLEDAQASFLRERNHLQKHVGASSIQALLSSNFDPVRDIDEHHIGVAGDCGPYSMHLVFASQACPSI